MTTMEVTVIISISAAIIAGLGYLNSRRSTTNQEAALKLQLTQHEERQKATVANQFDKLKTELSSQKSDMEKNNATVSLRLESIEKKFDNVEEMHTEIALTKQTCMHIMKSVEAIQGQLTRQSEQFSSPQSNGTPRQAPRRKKP